MARDDIAAFSAAITDMTVTAERLEATGDENDHRAAVRLLNRRDRLVDRMNDGRRAKSQRELQTLADAALIAAVEGHRRPAAEDVPADLAKLVPPGVKFPDHPSFWKFVRHPIDETGKKIDRVEDKVTSGVGAAVAVLGLGAALFIASRFD